MDLKAQEEEKEEKREEEEQKEEKERGEERREDLNVAYLLGWCTCFSGRLGWWDGRNACWIEGGTLGKFMVKTEIREKWQ